MGHHRSNRQHAEHGRTIQARALTEIGQAASYLETLAQALRAGGVTIRSGAGLVALRTSDKIELELEAGEEGRHSILHLALRWETPMPEERLDIIAGVAQQPAESPPAQEPAQPAKSAESGPAGRSKPGQ